MAASLFPPLLLMLCRVGLERVSIRDATWTMEDEEEEESERHPLSQQTIIQFVRSKPTLRWLRSDLSEENSSMLKRERPETTFIS